MYIRKSDIHLPYPLGRGPPVNYDPLSPTSSDDENTDEILPRRFDVISSSKRPRYVIEDQIRKGRLRTVRKAANQNGHQQAAENTSKRAAQDVTHEVPRNAVPAPSAVQSNLRSKMEMAPPAKRVKTTHVPGAFPDSDSDEGSGDISVTLAASVARPQKSRQPTVENCSEDEDANAPHRTKPLQDHEPLLQPASEHATSAPTPTLPKNVSHPPLQNPQSPIKPLTPTFLMPSRPPSPLLPTGPSRNPSVAETRSQWCDYHLALDTAGEKRATAATQRAGYKIIPSGQTGEHVVHGAAAKYPQHVDGQWETSLTGTDDDDLWQHMSRRKEAAGVEAAPARRAGMRHLPTLPGPGWRARPSWAPLVDRPLFDSDSDREAELQVLLASPDSPVATVEQWRAPSLEAMCFSAAQLPKLQGEAPRPRAKVKFTTPDYTKPAVLKPALKKPAFRNPFTETPTVTKPAVFKSALKKPVFKIPFTETPAVTNPAVLKSALKKPLFRNPFTATPASTRPTYPYLPPSPHRPAPKPPSLVLTPPTPNPTSYPSKAGAALSCSHRPLSPSIESPRAARARLELGHTPLSREVLGALRAWFAVGDAGGEGFEYRDVCMGGT
ncbi:hypothetical protein C7974DRAFT_453930 [Boeremia exigua]|uniref:uncharacterized protein n=1 Tax=Boeremia exigua TaxID=749465 RepID=UPI001E8DA454|nr:uncharacterized protein C7974DRAFT_453930 [Boeremia exigua]KAH6629272.1 hypothetical protein C7974DRAFT_453930 [Boeremia exigua]